MHTDSAFIMFIASDAKINRRILFVFPESDVTIKNVLSPISAKNTNRKLCVNPTLKPSPKFAYSLTVAVCI